MQNAYRSGQVRAAEAVVLRQVPEGALMARAARAISVEATRLIGFSYGARVLLLVGAGANGGDALFAGAELARRGVAVRAVLAVPERAHQPGLAALRAAGGRLLEPSVLNSDTITSDTVTSDTINSDPSGSDVATDLIIDGLLGIGATGALRAPLLSLARWANRSPAPVLAVDLPSGVDPDTGAVAGEAVRADLTVCMGALKTGLLVGAGREHAGRVLVIDIGITGELGDVDVAQLTDADVAGLLPRPGPADDKYTRGVVGVVAGSAEYPGAAQLAVSAARLGGVGAVRYAGHAAAEVTHQHPEVLVTDTVSGAGRVQAWAVGPGLSDTPSAREELRQVLAADVPVLVDADGLNLLDGSVAQLTGRAAPTVLTPHDREFERLFGEIGTDRVAATRRAARAAHAVVLLKGYATVIAGPDGRCLVNPTGVPALATAGSGDVLSGLIGSLLAAGVEPLLAAALGAYLHGESGSLAARSGPVGAVDLLRALPGVLASHRFL